MELIKPSIIKLEEGIKLTAKFQDGQTPFVETIALVMASDEDVLASRKNPSIMEQYLKLASVMDYEEAVEVLANFTQHVGNFSNKLQEKMQASVKTDKKLKG